MSDTMDRNNQWAKKINFLNQILNTESNKKHNIMNKVTVIVIFCWFGLLSGLQAQSVAIVKIKPVLYTVKPISPGPGYVWVNGYWIWDRRHRKNVWTNGHWIRVPQHEHFYTRTRIY